jgi:hypothetical protein
MNYGIRLFLKTLLIMHFATPLYAADSFVLITSVFNEKHPQRAQEYITCLEKNLAHPLIGKIHVVYDTSADTIVKPLWVHDYLEKHPTIAVTYLPHRPSFGELFKIAADLYPNSVVLVSNGDIYFNETLETLKGLDFSKLFLAMGRWDINSRGEMIMAMETAYENDKKVRRPTSRSQDVWVFKSPAHVDCDDINLGTPHCDHYLAYRIMAAGYDLRNPMVTVQCCHQHASNIRDYPQGGKHRCESAAVPGCTIKDIGNSAYKARRTVYKE